MTIKLYDYQEKLVSRTRQSYRDGYKAPCVVAPCGAGKSIIIAEIARLTTRNKKRVLFLVHRKELIEQITETFEFVGVNLDYVQFAMVQTLVRRLDNTTRPDLIITDENHHGLANSYRKIYAHFEEVLRLGFTATPIRLNGSGLGDVNDILIEEVTAEWLIENNYLSPYKYYAPKLINTNNLKLNNLKEFSNTSVDKEMKNVIYGDVIRHYTELADGEQAIAYCHSVEASKQTAHEFNLAGIHAEHIDGKTSKQERERVIQSFRDGKIKVLCNVDLIGEGFDVPDCSTVIMLRPTKSLSLFIQQSMRGMRYRPNKTSIIIDHVGNATQHGLPDMQRQWSLKGKKKVQEAEIKIRECTNCFAVYEPTKHKHCPLCGHVEEVDVRETEYSQDKNAELEEVTKDDFEVTLDFRTPEDCNSLQELQDLAKAKKYKPGWAWFQAKRLKLI